MPDLRRDRLRELLDAVLDSEHDSLTAMARGAFASPYHFSRQFNRGTGESPVALRRRVMLERAAWQLARGESVTEVALVAGYDSPEGFSRAYSRAFGHPPSSTPSPPDPTGGSSRHWLPAPNGVHFHPPMNLWVNEAEEESRPRTMQVTAHFVHHDLADTAELISLAGTLDEEAYRRTRLPGHTVLDWNGPEESIAAVLDHQVRAKEVWLASIEGADLPEPGADGPRELAVRHDLVAPRWVAVVRDVEQRNAWDDRLIDALCEPPESFVLGSVFAHVVTYSAHRRLLARHLLREAGLQVGHGDPIDWLRGTG